MARHLSDLGTWLTALSRDMGDSSAQPSVADDVADAPRSGIGGHFRRAVAPRVLGRLPADLGYEPTTQ
jgi:hypothetical protein